MNGPARPGPTGRPPQAAVDAETPEVTVVIVTFRTPPALLTTCLEHVRASTGLGAPPRVLVIDNGETDWAAVLGSEATNQALRTGANLGFGRAVNHALGFVSTTHTLLLNPDAEVEPTAIAHLIEGEAGRSRPALLVAWLLSAGSVQVDAYLSWVFSLQRQLTRRAYRRYLDGSAHEALVPVQKASGGALFARTGLLRDLGPFDEDFFLYGEDDDLSRRAQLAGVDLLAVPSARVRHAGGGSSESGGALVEQARVDATLRVLLKHHGRAAVAVGVLDLVAFTVLGLLARSTSSRDRRSRAARLLEVGRWVCSGLAPRAYVPR